MTEQKNVFTLDFDGGPKTLGEVEAEQGLTKIKFDLPQFNPGAHLSFMEQKSGRASTATIISNAEIVKIQAPSDLFAEGPLMIHVVMKRDSESNRTPLPSKGSSITLMPRDSTSALLTNCVASDEAAGVFTVSYVIEHIRLGGTAWLRNDHGTRCRVAVTKADLICLNSGVNVSRCVLHLAQAPEVVTAPPSIQKPLTIPSEQIVARKADLAETQDAEATPDPFPPETERSAQPPPEPLDHVVCEEEKNRRDTRNISLMRAVAILLFAAFAVTAFVPESDPPMQVDALPMVKSVAVAASATLASVMIVGEPSDSILPMSQENLAAFFGQTNATEFKGRVTGEVELGALGILCNSLVVYDVNEKTSDASKCAIVVPDESEPGVYALTPERSSAWFHQSDPSCFVDGMLPYPTARSKESLRVNVESCDWSFDPTYKCFDFSSCSFTIPRYTVE